MNLFRYPALSLLPLLAVACSGDSNNKTDAIPTAPGDANAITVKMGDNFFEPKEIRVRAGTTVRFVAPNIGKVAHNLHIASDRGIYRESPWIALPDPTGPEQTARLTWEVPNTPGVTYNFRCDYHEVDMIGTVTIE